MLATTDLPPRRQNVLGCEKCYDGRTFSPTTRRQNVLRVLKRSAVVGTQYVRTFVYGDFPRRQNVLQFWKRSAVVGIYPVLDECSAVAAAYTTHATAERLDSFFRYAVVGFFGIQGENVLPVRQRLHVVGLGGETFCRRVDPRRQNVFWAIRGFGG